MAQSLSYGLVFNHAKRFPPRPTRSAVSIGGYFLPHSPTIERPTKNPTRIGLGTSIFERPSILRHFIKLQLTWKSKADGMSNTSSHLRESSVTWVDRQWIQRRETCFPRENFTTNSIELNRQPYMWRDHRFLQLSYKVAAYL